MCRSKFHLQWHNPTTRLFKQYPPPPRCRFKNPISSPSETPSLSFGSKMSSSVRDHRYKILLDGLFHIQELIMTIMWQNTKEAKATLVGF